jgi:hypothetical protein
VFVKRFNPETHTNDYTIDTEAHAPGGPYELPFALPGAEEPGAEPMPQPEGEALLVVAPAHNCVSCHTDKASLKQMAVEEEEVQSEEASGEG